MEKIRIKFGDFWHDFDPKDNMFTRVLSTKFEIEFSDDPQYYFFTHAYNGKRDYLNYKCHRIFLGWENERADWASCDYVLDSDFYANNPRHKRFPIWAAWDMKRLCQPKDVNNFAGKKKFCCMVVSNPNAKERIAFFHELSKYKQVDSGGRHLNNVGYSIDNKMDFIKDYKFVISFENSSYPGYTTEKLIEPMLVNSIPIYWGNPKVGCDFNKKSFINIKDFTSYAKAIEHIIELDNNEDKYLEMSAQPWLNHNKVQREFTEEGLSDFLEYMIRDSKTKRPVGKSFYKMNRHKASLFAYKLKWVAMQKLGMQTGFR